MRGTLPLLTPAAAASTAWSLEAEEGEKRHAMKMDRWTQSRWKKWRCRSSVGGGQLKRSVRHSTGGNTKRISQFFSRRGRSRTSPPQVGRPATRSGELAGPRRTTCSSFVNKGSQMGPRITFSGTCCRLTSVRRLISRGPESARERHGPSAHSRFVLVFPQVIELSR